MENSGKQNPLAMPWERSIGKASASKLQQAVKGQVLWVDEAGFLSVRQMLELEEFAVEHNCRLVLRGDTKQHHSVQFGPKPVFRMNSNYLFGVEPQPSGWVQHHPEFEGDTALSALQHSSSW